MLSDLIPCAYGPVTNIEHCLPRPTAVISEPIRASTRFGPEVRTLSEWPSFPSAASPHVYTSASSTRRSYIHLLLVMQAACEYPQKISKPFVRSSVKRSSRVGAPTRSPCVPHSLTVLHPNV